VKDSGAEMLGWDGMGRRLSFQVTLLKRVVLRGDLERRLEEGERIICKTA
jgi:hypothetical protein